MTRPRTCYRTTLLQLVALLHAIVTPEPASCLSMAAKNCNNIIQHIHFNNAGDSPSPPQVQNAIFQHMQLESEVGGYRAADLASDRLQGVYDSVARLIGAQSPTANDGLDVNSGEREEYNARDEIALVESATVGWTRVFYSMLETKEREIAMLQEDNGSNNMHGETQELFILVSEAEYAANLVAAVKFARDRSVYSRFRWRVLPIPSSAIKVDGDIDDLVSSGVVDLDEIKDILDGSYAIENVDEDDAESVSNKSQGNHHQRYLDPKSIAMVCITHIPTNSGIINPVNEIGQLINDFNDRQTRMLKDNNQVRKLPPILYLVDACQSVGQISVNAHKMKCHALTATGRKYLRGPRGTGFLFIQKGVANNLEPSHVDHASAPVLKVMPNPGNKMPVWKHGLEEETDFGLSHSYQSGAARFEFWESNVATKLGFGEAINACISVGVDKIEDSCVFLGVLLRRRLREMASIKVYHDNFENDGYQMCGIVTFRVENVDAIQIKSRMENGVYGLDSDFTGISKCCVHLSVVPATSTPLDSARTGLGDKPLLRASLSYFNTETEIDLFFNMLHKVIDEQNNNNGVL